MAMLLFAAIFPMLGKASQTAQSQDQTTSNQSTPPPPAPPVGGPVPRQEENKTSDVQAVPERWNLFWQATSIGQYHGTFTSPYEGAYSLQDRSERVVSLTSTLFFSLRLDENTQLYFNGELAGGRGFSGVNGLANSSNGELPRVASATPKPYLARLFVSHDFGFGSARESFESDVNQLSGTRPMVRYTVTVGRFTLTDFFDDNRYTHDPRTQFIGWGVMFNGAWDYPADVRGYTWGWLHEFHTKNWSLRYASAAMPQVANGLRFDRRIFRDRGDVYEAEYRYVTHQHPGAVRVLHFENRARAGDYAQAIRSAKISGGVPDVTATRKVGTVKYGFGISAEQELTKSVGVFGRLGWNDGETESFAFTAIDRLATGGFSITGSSWRRRFDTAASELTVNGITGVHASYLAMGGHDFLIGDGRLTYGPETIWESYYSARLFPGFFASIDLQYITNPAYNRDRGPLWVPSLRLHWELGKGIWTSSN